MKMIRMRKKDGGENKNGVTQHKVNNDYAYFLLIIN